MKLQEQVSSLEQSKKLKELGITQVSCFAHCEFPSQTLMACAAIHREDTRDWSTLANHGEVIAAFTVAELGVMLPPHSEYKEGLDKRPFIEYYPHTHKEEWKAYNPFTKYGSEKIVFEVNTEAEARAAMLIYLLEQELTTPEEVNNRLNA